MWKVMLADDEPFIREGIEQLIPWKNLGCEVIYSASNGRELIHQMELELPDLVIIDIKMPVMGGLDVAQHIQDKEWPTKIILLTAYADFKYAHMAIKYNVSDYIIKTSALDDIPKAVEKVTRQLKETKLTCCRLILFYGITDGSSVIKMVNSLFESYSSVEFQNDLEEDCLLITGSEASDDNRILETLKKLQGLYQNFFQKNLTAGISRLYYNPKLLYDTYEETLHDLTRQIQQTGPGLYRITEYPDHTSQAERIPADENLDTIQNANLFIEQHYSSKLTLDDIADAVHTNPSYLSRIYKQKTGNNLFDVINARRIEKAKEYIAMQTHKIYEIAELVGYEDTAYFSRVFKKYAGISPKEYERSTSHETDHPTC